MQKKVLLKGVGTAPAIGWLVGDESWLIFFLASWTGFSNWVFWLMWLKERVRKSVQTARGGRYNDIHACTNPQGKENGSDA